MRRRRLRRDGSWLLPGVLLAAQTAAFFWVFLQYPVRGAAIAPTGMRAATETTHVRQRSIDWPPMVPRFPLDEPIKVPQDPYRVGPDNPDVETWPRASDRSFFQDRLGGRRNAVARGGGTQGLGSTEAAVTAGLRWLARHQSADGSWSARGPGNCGICTGADPDADELEMTSLGLLAFLGAGYTHLSWETYVDSVTGETTSWGSAVKSAIKWLLARQFTASVPPERRRLRAEAIAALALLEAWGITGASIFKDPAENCLKALTSARLRSGGWGTSPHAIEADLATTAWALCAIRVAKANGCRTDAEAVERAHAWLDREADAASGSGARVFAHLLTGADWCAGALIQVLQTAKTGPDSMDPDVWHWTTLALFHATALKRPEWRQWNKGLTMEFVDAQDTKPRSCTAGSWDAPEDCPGGRLRATALNVLTLETYYRYPRRLCEPALK